MRKLFLYLGLAALVLISLYYSLNYFLVGKWTIPGVPEYVAMAKPWNATVQAIYDFRADHGVMPKDLSDLVPAYLPQIPKDPNNLTAILSGDSLMVHAPLPHTGLVYSFQSGNEGWTVGGDFGVGALPLPKLASTHPSHKRRHRTTSPATQTKPTEK